MTEDPGRYHMPFGKHRSKSLDNIARTDGGLKYLDWCAGAFDDAPDVQEAIIKYLKQPVVAAELAKILEDED